MNRLIVSALVLAAVGLTACSGMQATSECKLEAGGEGRCKSMQDAYAAVQAGAPGVVSVFEQQGAKAGTATAGMAYGYLGNFPEPDKALPVFQQPKVYRPWLAPFVDADGVLHAGEYAYFNTPGAWNYGELRKPGAGAAVMGPVKPWETGLDPSVAGSKPQDGSGKSSQPPAPDAPKQPSAPVPPVVDSATGITQPYQRLN